MPKGNLGHFCLQTIYFRIKEGQICQIQAMAEQAESVLEI